MEFAEAYEFDLFVVYAAADTEFVLSALLPRIGLPSPKVLLIDDLTPGAPIVNEVSRGVSRSRFTVVVLSDAYVRDRWTVLGADLASYQSADRIHIIPLRLTNCRLPLHLEFRVALDCTSEARWDDEIARLRTLLCAPDIDLAARPTAISVASDRLLSSIVERYEAPGHEHAGDPQRNVLGLFVEPMGWTQPQEPSAVGDGSTTMLTPLVSGAIAGRTPCMILADFGTGKTWFMQMMEYRIAKRCLANKRTSELDPLLFNLRSFRRGPSSASPTSPRDAATVFSQVRDRAWSIAYGESAVSTCRGQLLHEFEEGRQLLLLDGLDEMRREDAQLLINEIGELSRSNRRSAIVMTCRRSFFMDPASEQRTADVGIKVFHALPWSRGQVLEYLVKAQATGMLDIEAATAQAQLDSVHGARDITSRALLAAMFVSQWNEIGIGGDVDVPSLYKRHIEKELMRWQGARLQRLTVEQLRWHMEQLAMLMFELDRRSITAGEMEMYLSRKFSNMNLRPLSEIAAAVTGDLRSNSLLLRHGSEYFFCHPSFGDFLVASLLLRSLQEDNFAPLSVLHRSRQYRGIIEPFLIPMLPKEDFSLLERLSLSSRTE